MSASMKTGTTFERHFGRIDADAAYAYAEATNDPNDAYRTSPVVPPLYTVSLIREAYSDAVRSIEPGPIEGARGGVHGAHETYIHRPAEVGMAVQWQVSLHSAHQTPAGVSVAYRIDVTTPSGDVLITHYWSNFQIGGRIAEDEGPPMPDHTFPEGARHSPIAVERFEIARDQGFRYAGASGDHAPHAIDDVAAHEEGYPGKIMQGMASLAMCSGAVVKHAAGGDPRLLRRIAGRFSAPVRQRQQMAVHLYAAGVSEDGRTLVAFEAVQEDKVVVKHGWAEIGQPPSPEREAST